MQARLAEDGALWVATYGGIGRYNGKKFTNYTIRNGLSSNLTYDIGFFNDTIWLLTRDGLDIMLNNKITNIIKPESKFSTAKLYIGDTDTRFIYNISTNKVYDNSVHHRLFNINTRTYHDSICIEKNKFPLISYILPIKDQFYYSNANFLYEINIQTLEGAIIQKFPNTVMGISGKKNNFGFLTVSSYGTKEPFYDSLFFYTISNESLIEKKFETSTWGNLRRQKEIFTYFNPQPNDFIIFDRESRVWQFKEKKLWLMAANINQLNDVMSYNTSYWFSTEKGLIKQFGGGFKYFKPEDGYPENVWSVLSLDDSRTVLASYSNGLYLVNNGTTKLIYRPLHPVDQSVQYNYYNGATLGYKNDAIIPHGTGVTVLNIETLKAIDITQNMNQASLTLYRAEDTKTILIGNMSNLVELDTNYNTRILFDVNSLGIKSTILSIEGNNQNYLLGLGRGLAEYSPKTGIGKLVVSSNIRVNDMVTDSTGTIWAATNLGLMQIKEDTLLPMFSSFINEDLLTLTISNNNKLFIGGTATLYVVNLSKYHHKKPNCMLAYRESAGYFAGEPGQNSFYNDEKGILWLPTSENVVRIDASLLPEPVKSTITTLFKGYAITTDATDSLAFLPTNLSVTLPFSHNNLHFEFEAVELDFPESLRFQYKLENSIENWTNLDDETNLNFDNLAPGKYDLHVRATISETFQDAQEYRLLIIIQPPFYYTWWFIGISLLFFLSFLFLLLRYFIKRERSRAIQQTELLRLKSQALGIQIDNHFLVNCTAKITLLSQEGKTSAAVEYSNNFVRFLQNNLSSLRKETITLSDELEMVKSYAKIEQSGSTPFDFNIYIDNDIDPLKIFIPPFLIQPLVENSIRHGIKLLKKRKGKININITHNKSGCLKINVSDNGKGLTNLKSSGNNIGMKIIEERLRHIGKESKMVITPLNPGLMVELNLCSNNNISHL